MFISHYLFATNYCMNIATYHFNDANQKKIDATLLDILHPFYKIENKIISIYSGKFKTYEDANRLLGLTKIKYKNAKVTKCDDNVVKYIEKKFSNDGKSILKKSKFIDKKDDSNTLDSVVFYRLQVLNVSVDYDKNKINKILKKLPNSYLKIENNRLKIFSGKFQSLKSAKVIKGLLEKEFKDTQIIKFHKKLQKNRVIKNYTEKKNSINQPILKKSFDVYTLDEKGLIPHDISSGQVTTSLQGDYISKNDINALNSQSNNYFNGLYLKVNSAWDVLNDTVAYDTRLEFNIFDQGYYEIKNKNEKNRVVNKITFLKLLKDIKILEKEKEFLKIKQYTNSINASSLLLKLRVLESNLHTANLKYKNGVITKYEYEKYLLSIQLLKDELSLFKNLTLLKIPKNLLRLLNQIERVKLIDSSSLVGLLEKNSLELELSKTLKDKELLQNRWIDQLRVNLYVSQRKMYLTQEQRLVGVDVRIPLSTYEDQTDFKKMQDKIVSKGEKLKHIQIKETLKETIAIFKYKQQKLRTYSYELSKIKEYLNSLTIINNSAYASYAKIDFSDEQKSIDNYFNKYMLIQHERINTYKELIDIMFLIHSTGIEKILVTHHL